MKNFFVKEVGFQPDITHGICPNCALSTILVSLSRDHYRCVTCGTDLEQKINGHIKYMPLDHPVEDQPEMKDVQES